MKKLSKSR